VAAKPQTLEAAAAGSRSRDGATRRSQQDPHRGAAGAGRTAHRQRRRHGCTRDARRRRRRRRRAPSPALSPRPTIPTCWRPGGTRGVAADAAKARALYHKAFDLGVAQAQKRLDALR